MEADPGDHRQANRRIRTAAFVATAVLLVGGFTIALMPSLVFHSGLASVYGWYPTAGLIVGLLSLVPANIWAVSALRSRMGKPLLIVLLVVLTVIAAAILFVAFVFIYLSTIDWLVF